MSPSPEVNDGESSAERDEESGKNYEGSESASRGRAVEEDDGRSAGGENYETTADIDLQLLEELAKDTAIGDTMYDKRWVIENILAVGKHFQSTAYFLENETVRELDSDIEEKMCTLWDISVEEDVSKFYLQYGVLDIFTELFSNPNVRVKEIAIGLMTNMVYHESVFVSIIEKDKYLEKCLKLLEEKDSPTLLIVFRCLHSYGFNLFNMLNQAENTNKEDAKNYVERWLIFLSIESVAQNIGLVLASCRNHEVLQNAARFLSILAELWDQTEERRKVSQAYTEEQFLHCLLEAMNETLREDKTEKHFLVFLYLVFDRDLDKDMYSSISSRVIHILEKICIDHILEYSSIDEHDMEFIFNIFYVLTSCLESGEFGNISESLGSTLREVRSSVERASLEDNEENKQSILSLIDRSVTFVEAFAMNNLNRAQQEDGLESCESTPAHREAGATDSPYFRTPRDTPRSPRGTPGRSPWSSRREAASSSPATWRTPR